ncbi:MAG: hypothetical protein HGA45_38220, partial [Chloroflexales bacterium]|nr:hypothetical protein [Chloroflexales bacterium]
MTGAMHAVNSELALVTALEHGDTVTAQRVLQLMRAAAEDEDDPITRWQATYLEALIARAASETAPARRGLEAIVAWGEAHVGDLDDRLSPGSSWPGWNSGKATACGLPRSWPGPNLRSITPHSSLCTRIGWTTP